MKEGRGDGGAQNPPVPAPRSLIRLRIAVPEEQQRIAENHSRNQNPSSGGGYARTRCWLRQRHAKRGAAGSLMGSIHPVSAEQEKQGGEKRSQKIAAPLIAQSAANRAAHYTSATLTSGSIAVQVIGEL